MIVTRIWFIHRVYRLRDLHVSLKLDSKEEMDSSSERLPNKGRVVKDALIFSLLTAEGNAMKASLSCLHYKKHWSQREVRRDRADVVFVSPTLNIEWKTAGYIAKVEVTRSLMTCLSGSPCPVKYHVLGLFQLLKKGMLSFFAVALFSVRNLCQLKVV